MPLNQIFMKLLPPPRGWWTIMWIRNSDGTITKTRWGSLLLPFSQVWKVQKFWIPRGLAWPSPHFTFPYCWGGNRRRRAIRQKAIIINLNWLLLYVYFSDNRISDLQRDELQGLGSSLKSLDLSGNSLTSVPEGIFWNLQRLEILKLARNNIIQIHSMAFKNGVRTKSKVFHKKM